MRAPTMLGLCPWLSASIYFRSLRLINLNEVTIIAEVEARFRQLGLTQLLLLLEHHASDTKLSQVDALPPLLPVLLLLCLPLLGVHPLARTRQRLVHISSLHLEPHAPICLGCHLLIMLLFLDVHHSALII